MKYTILNNTNIDFTEDLQKVVDFFKSKGWSLEFDVKKTNIPVPTPVQSTFAEIKTDYVVQPNGIQYSGKTVFIFDGTNMSFPNGSITSYTYNKDFISLVYTEYNKNIGWCWLSLAHEIMHTLFKTLSTQGITIFDCMDYGIFKIDGKMVGKSYYKNDDPYAPDGNFAEAFKRLEPYKNKFMTTTQPTYKYFKPNEIVGLKPELVQMLDKARGLAGVPFSISSGFRTPDKNSAVGGVENSAHLLGKAVDIHCGSSVHRLKMLTALLSVGFTRMGIGSDFIHVDIGTDADNLPQNVCWTYYK